jgi:ABC-type uncharacterized transport system permease subunit
MSLSPVSQLTLWCSGAAVLAYALAAWPSRERAQGLAPSTVALLAGWLLHAVAAALDMAGAGPAHGVRLGFAPVLSASVWLVIAVHAVESRFVTVPAVRIGLATAGASAVMLAVLFPGEQRPFHSALGPWHFMLGVATHALIAAAVLHGLWLGAAETRLRQHKGLAALAPASEHHARALGLPLLQLERLTFRFVQAGFAVLSATLLLGVAVGPRVDHKTVFSLLAWACFAVLLWGRASRGWRGRIALRWLYAGGLLLLLAYVGSRFVYEVLLGRSWS